VAAARYEFDVLACLAAATLVAVRLLPTGPLTGLAGRYWINPSLIGPLVGEVAGSLLSAFALRRSLPGRALEQASAEWSGFFPVEDAGAYQFELRSDDGSWLFVRVLPSHLPLELPGWAVFHRREP
jgi:PA14 domain